MNSLWNDVFIISGSFYSYFLVLILGTGECQSLEMGVARKNYESHVNRSRGWTNECIGYHINGNIFDAFTANSIIEIEGAQDKYVSHTNCIEFNICKSELCELSPIQTIEPILLLYSPN